MGKYSSDDEYYLALSELLESHNGRYALRKILERMRFAQPIAAGDPEGAALRNESLFLARDLMRANELWTTQIISEFFK